MVAWLHYQACSSCGRRSFQEDDYGVFELPPSLAAGDLLLVLADGMGGARAGERASAIAVRAFIDAYPAVPGQGILQRLQHALEHANRALAVAIATDQRALAGMGCTLLAVVFTDKALYWISVGDSLLWVWRRGRLQRLNEDHSYRQILAECVAAGEISGHQAAFHPQRNALLSALTGEPLALVDLCEQPCLLEIGDKVLLASDGLLTLSETEIAAQLSNGSEPQLLCQQLLSAVTAADDPDQDNTTVMVAQLDGRPEYPCTAWQTVVASLVLVLFGLAAGWLYYWEMTP